MAAPPNPDQTVDDILFQAFTGLKNVVSEERLGPNDLARAVNVDIDDAGQVRRRRGYERKITGNFHSLWNAPDGQAYAVKNGSLVAVMPNWTTVTLKAGVGPDPLSYVATGETIFYSSRTTSGKLLNGETWAAWGAEVSPGQFISPVVRPTSTLPAIRGKLLGPPPFAEHLAYHNGRIYLAHDNVLWATELWQYDYVEKVKNFKQFESKITMVAPVIDGIYIGTEQNTYFLSGNYHEMRSVVVGAGVVPGSDVVAPPEMIAPIPKPEKMGDAKSAVMFLTTTGLVAGLDSGRVVEMTSDKFLFPTAVSAAALFRQEYGVNQYIGVLDSGGDPTQAVRFGDYIDADIRRGGNWEVLGETLVLGDEIIAVKV